MTPAAVKVPGTLQRFASKIESIDDERGVQNGYWVNLKAGWIDGESGCHAIHENTLAACAIRFAFVEPCKCEDCERVPVVVSPIDELFEKLSGGATL